MYKNYVQAADEEMKFLGVMGIYKESCKIILFSCKKMLFTQITLAFILPLCLIFLANVYFSNLLFPNMFQIQVYTQYIVNNSTNITPSKHDGSSISTQEFIHYFLFKSAKASLLLLFSLLSTAAVTYTTICSSTVHNLKEMLATTSNKAAFRRVLKRLTLTFVYNFLVGLMYVIVAFFLMFLAFKTWTVFLPRTWILYAILVALFLVFLVGFVYLQVVWQVSTVVSVVEEESGLGAMIRSGALMKGKVRVGVIMFLKFKFCYVAMQQFFKKLMMDGVGDQSTSSATGKVINKLWFGMVCLLVVLVLFLFGLVVQTVFYSVCKSYHHEIIDKSVLFDHSATDDDEGCYLGDQFVPLKSKDGVLGQIDV